jgi:hypothetical protein
VLHQRTGAGTGPPPDVDLAAGGAVGGGVAAIPLEGQGGAGIEPAHIGRRRAIDDDLRPFKTEGADPLPRVLDRELEGRAILGPERATDVVVAGSQDLELGFTGVKAA